MEPGPAWGVKPAVGAAVGAPPNPAPPALRAPDAWRRSFTMASMMARHWAMASAVEAVRVMTRWAVPGAMSCSCWCGRVERLADRVAID